HLLTLPDIGDLALAQSLLHRRFDLSPGTPEEALAVAQALALGVGSTVDYVHCNCPPRARLLATLPGLVHPHIPLDEPADLPFGITARHHALQKIGVFFLGLGILLRTKADHRQQVLDLREHASLD